MGAPSWGTTTSRDRQKQGAWTRKKLRRKRAEDQARRGGEPQVKYRRDSVLGRVPIFEQ